MSFLVVFLGCAMSQLALGAFVYTMQLVKQARRQRRLEMIPRDSDGHRFKDGRCVICYVSTSTLSTMRDASMPTAYNPITGE